MRIYHPIPNEDLLADLRRVAAGAGLTRAHYEAEGRYSPATQAKHFGGWGRALARAGVKPAAPPPPPEPVQRILRWSEGESVRLFRTIRWPAGHVRCPRCEQPEPVRPLPTQQLANSAYGIYACEECAYHFSDLTGTVFQQRSTAMKVWLAVLIMERAGAEQPRLRRARWLGVTTESYARKVMILQGSQLAHALGEAAWAMVGTPGQEAPCSI